MCVECLTIVSVNRMFLTMIGICGAMLSISGNEL